MGGVSVVKVAAAVVIVLVAVTAAAIGAASEVTAAVAISSDKTRNTSNNSRSGSRSVSTKCNGNPQRKCTKPRFWKVREDFPRDRKHKLVSERGGGFARQLRVLVGGEGKYMTQAGNRNVQGGCSYGRGSGGW